MKKQILIPAMALLLFAACKKESPINPVQTKAVDTSATVVTIKHDTLADKSFIRLKVLNTADTVYSDETEVVFYKKATNAYYAMEDAPDRQDFGDVDFALLSSDNIPLSIDHVPYSYGMQIRLTTKAKKDGNFTIRISGLNTIPSKIHVWLKDNLKKDSTDLRSAKYNFSMKQSDTTTFGANRFKIVLD